MKTLIELTILVALAMGIGLVGHLVRPDKENKIKFVTKKYDFVNPVKKTPKKEDPVVNTEVKAETQDPPHPQGNKTEIVKPETQVQETKTEVTTNQGTNQQDTESNDDHDHDHGVEEILAKEAYKDYQDGGVWFIDVRRTKAFKEGHVEGAIHISLHEALYDQQFSEFLEEHGQEEPLIIYCNGGSCEDSHTVANKFQAAGFENVRVMKDGYPGWLENEYPTAKGAQSE